MVVSFRVFHYVYKKYIWVVRKKKKEERNENEIKEGYKQQLDFINDPRTTFCEAVEKLIFHEES